MIWLQNIPIEWRNKKVVEPVPEKEPEVLELVLEVDPADFEPVLVGEPAVVKLEPEGYSVDLVLLEDTGSMSEIKQEAEDFKEEPMFQEEVSDIDPLSIDFKTGQGIL